MSEEQYWLITLKAEDLFGADPFSGKEIAKIIALTSTPKEPEFSAVMDGIMDGLRIGGRNAAYSYDIALLYLDRQFLDKLPSLHKWDGKDLKLWVASRSKDA